MYATANGGATTMTIPMDEIADYILTRYEPIQEYGIQVIVRGDE